MHHPRPRRWDPRTARTARALPREHERTESLRSRPRRRVCAMPRSRVVLPCAERKSGVPMTAVDRPASGSPPTRAPAAHVDVGEGPVVACATIDAYAAGELGMLPLHLLHGAQNDFRIA